MIDIFEQYIRMLERAPRELTKPYRVSDQSAIREYDLQILYCIKHVMFVGKDYMSCTQCEGEHKAWRKMMDKADKLKTEAAKDKIYKAFSESDDNCDDKHWIRVLRQDEWQAIYLEMAKNIANFPQVLSARFNAFANPMAYRKRPPLIIGEAKTKKEQRDTQKFYEEQTKILNPEEVEYPKQFTSMEQLWAAFTLKKRCELIWAKQDWAKEKSNGR